MRRHRDTYIWVSQVLENGGVQEVVKFRGQNADATARVFGRIERIFPQSSEPLKDWDVLVELVENSDLGDRSRVLAPHQAEWLLGEFLHLSKRSWRKALLTAKEWD